MKFNIITLGCKVNQYESNFIRESLESNGFSFCEDIKESDVVIVNTCSVTDTSDKKSLKTVRKVRRENPSCILVVCGCSTQNNEQRYQDMDIDILLGNKQKSNLPKLIEEYKNTKEKYKFITRQRDLPFEDMNITKFDQVRAYIKIQDGCNNFCSYCIIPYVRGDIAFKDYDKVIMEAAHLVKNGYKEIVLTGIHTGSYKTPKGDLVDLINELSKIPGLDRIRLSSVEITELDSKFITMLKDNRVFCDHLHVPLQSGTDEILKVMNRKYDTKFYENKIKEIRSIIPDIAITTDVIVGHNYETDELFAKTYEFCKKMEFAKIHVFPFSVRTGTASSKMPQIVPEHIRKLRAKNLISLSEKLEKEYYQKFIGKKLTILIEENKNGKSIGHTTNYLRVVIPENLNINEIYLREINERAD